MALALLFTSCAQEEKRLEDVKPPVPEEKLQVSQAVLPEAENQNPGLLQESESAGETKKAGTGLKAVQPKKYLLVNGIQTDPVNMQKESPDMILHVDRLEIKGLKDKTLQEKLNKEFEEDARKFIDRSVLAGADREKAKDVPEQRIQKNYSYSIAANYNNILSLGFYSSEYWSKEYSWSKAVPVAYELKSGKKLGLQDLFADGVDVVKLVNQKLTEYIIRENVEEYALTKAFQGIYPDQPFYLTENMLVVVFDDRSPEFVSPEYRISIPLDEFGGAFVAYDKYWNAGENLYEKERLSKKLLPGPIKIKWDSIKENKPEYNLWVQKAKFENTGQKELEDKLNAALGEVDIEGFKQKAVKSYESSAVKIASEKVYNTMIHANYDGMLSFSIYENTTYNGKPESAGRRFRCFDTAVGKEMKLKDLFNGGYDYKKMFKKNITQQLGDRKLSEKDLKRLDQAIDRAGFFIEGEGIHLCFKPGELSEGIKEEIQFYNPFEKIGQENLVLFN